MPNRFVILHHVSAEGEHWDLMLERHGALLTWQLHEEPHGLSSLPIPATRIGDHRKAYLQYEGPLTGDRGTVRRVDAGTVTFVDVAPDRYTLELGGRRLRGLTTLTRGPEHWVLAQSP